MSDIDPKLSRLYREVSTEGPPPALDAAILAAARQHLAKPKPRERLWWSRWLVPASLMATLVMGVSITLLITQEHPETLEGETVRQSSAPSTSAEAKREPSPVAPPAPSASKAAPMRSQAGAAITADATLKALPRSPEAWLGDIRRLIRDGREKEAVEQLAEFRKAFPGVSIPEDLGR